MTFSSQKIKFYVGKDGTTYGASRTDQSGVRPSLVDGRTVCGEPVEYIGEWNKSQIPYAPFKSAVEQGMATLLARREGQGVVISLTEQAKLRSFLGIK